MRKGALGALAAWGGPLWLNALAGAEDPGEANPNIVILLADDLGWNDVGYHGSDIRTPRIDAFVREGLELDRFYVCPICSPTRAGLMTGRYPHRFGLRDTVIPPWRDFGLATDEETLPEVLASAGYTRRACIGKWHLGHSRLAYHPLNRGFTHFYGHYNGNIDYFTHKREGELDWHRNFEPCHDEGYSTDLLAREAVRFIEESPATEPFFLYVPFNAPHAPLQAEEDDLKTYGFSEDERRILPPDPTAPGFGVEGRGNSKRQTYAAMVTAMDSAMGRILDALDAKGIAENTLVLFFSDNGGTEKSGGDNAPLRGQKSTVWEGGVRVPAAIRWPKELEGARKVEALTGYVDILPTLCRITGAQRTSEKPLDGLDVFDVLRGSRPEAGRVFYLGQGAVATQDWKLKEDELFHLASDPNETEDVAQRHQDIVNKLSTDLKAFEVLKSDVQVPPTNEGRAGFKAPKDWAIREEVNAGP